MEYNTAINLLTLEMCRFDAGDARRIQHFLKVHAFAKLIGEMERIPEETALTLPEVLVCRYDVNPYYVDTLDPEVTEQFLKSVHQKYYDQDLDKKLEAKSIIYHNLEEQGSLEVETIGEQLFGDEAERFDAVRGKQAALVLGGAAHALAPERRHLAKKEQGEPLAVQVDLLVEEREEELPHRRSGRS